MDGFRHFCTRCIPLVFLLALGVVAPTYADSDDVHQSGIFELDTRAGVDGDQDKKNDPIPTTVGDANTTDDAVDGDDWANIYEDYTPGDIPMVGPSSAFAISFVEDHFANGNINNGAEPFVALRTPENSFFTGGGSKDTNGIQEGPWLYDTTNDQVPDKNDIVNAFAAAYVDDKGHTILYFGLDTYSVNGDSNAGFWFTRQDISLEPLAPGASTGSFVGEHENGDIFVAVAYTEGGTVGDIDVYEWVGDDATGSLMLIASGKGCESPDLVDVPASANDADFDDDGDVDVCGVINKLLPGEDFGENPIYNYANTLVANNPLLQNSYKYESGAMVEFGLDLNAVLGEDIGCFSTFIAESRSSQSPTAQLKDFAMGSFDLCGVKVSKYCEAELNSVGNAANILFYGQVENIGAVEVVTTLEEDIGVFNVVCIDANDNGRCGVVWDPTANGGAGGWVIGLLEVAPPGLTGLGTDTVSFNHASGVIVAYEGSYTDNGPFEDDNPNGGPGFDFTDTVMATSVFGSDMVEDEATAVCSTVGIPNIEITKSCTNAAIENYNTFVADISGTVTNTGNVQLDNVQFSDSTNAGPDAVNYAYLRSDLTTFSEGDSLAAGEVLTYTADVSSTTSTTHMNTITVTAENTFDSNDTVSDMATAPSGGEICEVNPTASIDVTKDCAAAGVDLVLESGVLKIKVNMDVSVSNPSESDVALKDVTVSDAEGGLAYVSGAPFNCNTEGTVCTATSDMDPGDSAVFTQSFFPDTLGTDILGTLTNPTSVTFQNYVE